MKPTTLLPIKDSYFLCRDLFGYKLSFFCCCTEMYAAIYRERRRRMMELFCWGGKNKKKTLFFGGDSLTGAAPFRLLQSSPFSWIVAVIQIYRTAAAGGGLNEKKQNNSALDGWHNISFFAPFYWTTIVNSLQAAYIMTAVKETRLILLCPMHLILLQNIVFVSFVII